MQATIDALLKAAVSRGDVPGVVAMAGTKDGVLYEGAFGQRSIALADVPMTSDTIFLLASMTKAITSTAAMQLVERGLLSLDGALADTLPQYRDLKVLQGFDDAGEPILRPAQRSPTLRELLTHSAGFGYDIWNADLRRFHEKHGLPRASSGDPRGLDVPLIFDPGTRWEYGINTDIVGRLVEAVSGQLLETYVRENVTGPLRMNDTGFAPSAAFETRIVGMHARRPDGTVVALPRADQPAVPMGGGGMYGTAPDYLRFVRMFLGDGALDGQRVLKPETVETMAAPQMGSLVMNDLPTVKPELSNPIALLPGTAKTWGLGFMINQDAVPGGRGAGSLAWAGLRNTYFWIDRRNDVAGVLLTQILPFADPTVLGLLAAFERAVYSERR